MAEVLVIEDMAGVQHTINTMLRRAGHTVTMTADGAAGLEQLRQRRFDLVITDMLMPDVDGMEVLVRLAEMPSRPPVIAMSGGGAGVSAEAALKAAKLKADAFLQKPFDRAELLAAVDKLLGRSAA
jgi:DNA-binding response OmpR family regulator